MVRAVAEQILPIGVSNLKKIVRHEISVVKKPGKFIVVLVDLWRCWFTAWKTFRLKLQNSPYWAYSNWEILNSYLYSATPHKLVRWVWSRTQSEIEKVMRKGGEKVLSQIEEVSMDRTGNYKSLVRKLCPNAEVTVGIFPVVTRVQSELNQA